MRKTVTVQSLKDKINQRIRKAPSEDARKALCLLLESILLETDNYNGFNFVEWLEGGSERWRKDTEPQVRAGENVSVDERYPKGLGSTVPQDYLGPEYLRRYY